MRESLLISDQDIIRLSGLLREHVLDPHTLIVRGTLGTNREKRIDQKRLKNPNAPRVLKTEGYILYNFKTKVASFYGLKDRNLRTFQSI